MTRVEGEINMDAEDFDIRKALDATPPYHVYNPDNSTRHQEKYPHVKNINEYTSHLVEAEIAALEQVPTVRRPLSARRLATLIPTILG